MKRYCITFRSVTYAQRGERVLRRRGLECTMQRAPRSISDRGCSYCLRVRPAEALLAVEALRRDGAAFSGLFTMDEGGAVEELPV